MVESADKFSGPQRIAIIGSGAVGCYYGGRLVEGGNDVHFLMRSDLEAVRERGLQVKSVKGDFHLTNVNAYRTTLHIGACDLVIIALKATANPVLPDILPPLLKEDTVLVTLQNGLGNDGFLAENFGADRVVGGLCFVCINRTAPGVIEHTSQGMISLGDFTGSGHAAAVAELFQRSGIDGRMVENLACEQWKKLVWNVPFNGLSIVAGGVDTEKILASPPLELLVRELMHEVVGAAAELGHALPLSLVDEMVTRTRTMGGYKPSSLIDYLEGREVEVEAIWGEPCRRATSAGAGAGRLEMLYHLIKHLVATDR